MKWITRQILCQVYKTGEGILMIAVLIYTNIYSDGLVLTYYLWEITNWSKLNKQSDLIW